MKTIHWRGLRGYGDFVNPAMYSHNESVRIDDDVHVIFHFTEHNRRFKPEDKSTFEDIIKFLFDNTDKTDVTKNVTWEAVYSVKYDLIPEPQDSNGLDNLYSPFNHRFCKKDLRWNGGKEGSIAVISTAKHQQKFVDIKYNGGKKGDKAWKDPWPYRWEEFCERFERLGVTVNHIHYEMSVEEIVEILRESSMVYGYQAGATWLAKWIGTPMVVCSQAQQWTEGLFPWSVWYGTKHFESIFTNMFEDYETSLEKLKKFEHNLPIYKHTIPGSYVRQAFSRFYGQRTWPWISSSSKQELDNFQKKEQEEIEEFLKEIKSAKTST